jgi:hypothetical protein
MDRAPILIALQLQPFIPLSFFLCPTSLLSHSVEVLGVPPFRCRISSRLARSTHFRQRLHELEAHKTKWWIRTRGVSIKGHSGTHLKHRRTIRFLGKTLLQSQLATNQAT